MKALFSLLTLFVVWVFTAHVIAPFFFVAGASAYGGMNPAYAGVMQDRILICTAQGTQRTGIW